MWNPLRLVKGLLPTDYIFRDTCPPSVPICSLCYTCTEFNFVVRELSESVCVTVPPRDSESVPSVTDSFGSQDSPPSLRDHLRIPVQSSSEWDFK